jgi:protein-disulfide isomerase
MTDTPAQSRLPMIAVMVGLALLGAGGGYLYSQSQIGGSDAGSSITSVAAKAAEIEASRAGMSDAERKATEAVVRAYILENPEILTEAAQVLELRQTASRLKDAGPALTTPFAGAIDGNPNGDITLVEFTDYGCGFCRASVADVQRLIAGDKKLRVVFREVPILTPASLEAAKWALAAAKQGKHKAFHDAMFSGDKPSAASIQAAARTAGLDMARAQRDIKSQAILAEIEANQNLMQKIGVGGTPTFVVGDQIMEGALGYDALKAAIAKARKKA